jgi:hypothetical protein
MEYTREICKITDNQIVFPIKDYESIGDSLSSINYNFNALDIYTCNFEYSASNLWNSIYNQFSENSANWLSTMNLVKTNSGCWTDTYNSVRTLSSQWLKPISLIYPYAADFSVDGSTTNDIIAAVTNWVNETLPVFSGTCYNFIVGQELYIFTPLYSEINRVLSQTKVTGVKTVRVRFAFSCIGKGKKAGFVKGSVDCGSQTLNIQIPDQFVSEFVGLKFIVDDTVSRWVYDSSLYN